jgi:mannose-6-phosphate isomerase-like protein (cupin superfamily)
MKLAHRPISVSILVTMLLSGPAMPVAADEIAVTSLGVILRNEPLLHGDSTAAIVASVRAGAAELGVLVLSKNRLHHHEAQDHVLYVARGTGTARLESSAGQVETRAIKPGDILSLPRGRKHGFEKTGGEDLVFLVVATPLPPGVAETTFHE